MTQSILVAIDDSEQSTRALETAITAFVDPEVTLIHVVDPSELARYSGFDGPSVTDFRRIQDRLEAAGQRRLAAAADRAAELGADVKTVCRNGDVTRTVVEYAEDHDADHVVVGSHGRSGVSRILLGSVAEGIVRRAPVPVTVVR